MSTLPPETAASVAEQAEFWFARMRSDRRRPVDEFRFRQWLAESEAHQREYAAIEALWSELDAVGDSAGIRELRTLARIESAPPPAVRRRRARRWTAAAAIVVALVAGTFALNPTLYEAGYETGVGGRHAVHLLDGSRITLNTDTRLHVAYDLRGRRVRLDGGQAHFDVSHSRFWPFEVDAGSSVVRARGTAFDVYRRDGEVQVTLVQGRVEVYRPRTEVPGETARSEPPAAVLEPGEQVSVSARGVSPVQQTSVPKTTAWLHGRLVFDEDRLEDVLAEVNRYSPVRIIVEDPVLARVRVSGVFRAGRAEGFLGALRESVPIEARRRPDGHLLITPIPGSDIPERITAPAPDMSGPS